MIQSDYMIVVLFEMKAENWLHVRRKLENFVFFFFFFPEDKITVSD